MRSGECVSWCATRRDSQRVRSKKATYPFTLEIHTHSHTRATQISWFNLFEPRKKRIKFLSKWWWWVSWLGVRDSSKGDGNFKNITSNISMSFVKLW